MMIDGRCHVSTRGEMGHIVLTVLGMVAQMERRFIKERQREGIERAKAEGTYLGGKRRLDRDRIKALHAAGHGPAAIARAVGCSRMQVYLVLQGPRVSVAALAAAASGNSSDRPSNSQRF